MTAVPPLFDPQTAAAGPSPGQGTAGQTMAGSLAPPPAAPAAAAPTVASPVSLAAPSAQSAPSQRAQPATSLQPAPRIVYAVGGVRRLLICLLILLLLPFFAAVPFMTAMRVQSGLWDDVVGLVIFGVGFAIIMGLLLINLMFSLRARVDLGPSTIRLTMPSGRGPTPMLSYRTHEFPYGDIAAVETRREIYGAFVAPVLLRGARIIKKDGSVIKLGYDSEANTAPAFPYAEIAASIAARAGVPVTDAGSVRRSAVQKMRGVAVSLAGPADQIDDAEIARLNGQHRVFVWAMIAGLIVLVAAGIARDLTNPPSSHSATPIRR